MAIEFRCTKCGKLLRTKDDTAGKQAKCPECGTVLQIPGPGEAPPPPPTGFAPPPAQDIGYGATSPGDVANPYASPQFGGPMASMPDSTGRTGPPWERDGQSFNTLVETAKGFVLNPTSSFDDMRRSGGIGKPFLFGVVGAVVGAIGLGIQFGLFSMLGAAGRGVGPMEAMMSLLCSIPMWVLGMTVGLFINSAIWHLLLMLVGGARYGYEATFRVVAYAAGSSLPLLIVPIVGLFTGILQFVLIIIGFSRAHEISIGKSLLAVLLPTLICCVLGLLFWGMIVALIVAGAQGGDHSEETCGKLLLSVNFDATAALK